MRFDDIYINAEGYRKEFQELYRLLIQVSEEKSKIKPLVSWFRLRNRKISKVINPMILEVQERIKKEKDREQSLVDFIRYLSNAKFLIKNDKIMFVEITLQKNLFKQFNLDLRFPDKKRNVIQWLTDIEKEMLTIKKKIEMRKKEYKTFINTLEESKELFQITKRTKDIDREKFIKVIQSVNNGKQNLGIKGEELEEIPDSYSEQIMEELYKEIRKIVAQIDSRYPMKIYLDSRKILRKVIHDISNDRGTNAFLNRANEIEIFTSKAIKMFNRKYWQITGQRWERIGTQKHGYQTVPTTHSPLKDFKY